MTNKKRRRRPPTWREWSRTELRLILRANLHRIILWILASLSVVIYNCTRPVGAERKELPVPDLVWPDEQRHQPEK